MDDANVPVSTQSSQSRGLIHFHTYAVVIVSALPRLLGRESPCVYQNTQDTSVCTEPILRSWQDFPWNRVRLPYLDSVFIEINPQLRFTVGPMWTLGIHGTCTVTFVGWICSELSCRPMSQISAIFGTDDDDEILTSLYLIANVSSIRSSNLSTVLTVLLEHKRFGSDPRIDKHI